MTISSAQPIVFVNNLAAIWTAMVLQLLMAAVFTHRESYPNQDYVGLLYRRTERKTAATEPNTTSC